MKRNRKIKRKTGQAPGTLIYTGFSEGKSSVRLINIGPEKYSIIKEFDIREKIKIPVSPSKIWLNVTGLTDIGIIEQLGKNFYIHKLFQEDILSISSVPKIDISDDSIFIIMKSIDWKNVEDDVNFNHIAIMLRKNAVISFSDSPEESYRHLLPRLDVQSSRLRQDGADYLLYALLDSIFDHYLLVSDFIDEKIEDIELAAERGGDEYFTDIFRLKKKILSIRKVLLPMKDVLKQLINTKNSLISEDSKKYFSDANDHLMSLMQSNEDQRNALTALIELHMTMAGYRMNKVMNILTLVASIFIPLTFIAGVYGMNFKYMPELEYKYAYFIVMGLMFIIGMGLFLYMKRKKWF